MLAVTKERRVFGRGSNFFCQLGFSKQKEYYRFFTEISPLAEYKITSVYAGYLHSLLMTSDGKILGFGCNGCGQFLSRKKGEMNYVPSESIIEKVRHSASLEDALALLLLEDHLHTLQIQNFRFIHNIFCFQ